MSSLRRAPITEPRGRARVVVPGLRSAQEGVAVLGPGERRVAQDLPEHRVGYVGVGGGQVAKRGGLVVSDR